MIEYHYPPELLSLLVDTIPLLCRSKKDVLLFFRGAGVGSAHTSDLAERVQKDRTGINKYEIVRTILSRMNERGEAALGERRAILRRVVEFDDFTTCWESDRLKAQGLVSQISKLVDKKDSFTRMREERDRERREHRAVKEAELNTARERLKTAQAIKADLFALFSEADVRKRGKALEGVLNRLFGSAGILVREAFERKEPGVGIVEQIDGVIELDGTTYLIEMKWLNKTLGTQEIGPHLVRVYGRGDVGGIVISNTRFSEGALGQCRDALAQKTIVLMELEEIVLLLEREGDILALLRKKITAARLDKTPFVRA